ncbi:MULTISPECIES: tRNA lysidine(34) synthetase TilS [unclassified Ekhidna]|uniref:tRNA lysidine(34) synthetase TilS n=1 Tax=unclassified Ekhidna TaxID=2632188 RepID=UPI0032DE4478
MHSLQKQFHDFIHSNHLVLNDEKILLAVSGGLDSMVMADLFLKGGYAIEIAHCNFGLRGDESDEDEAFVLEWADQNGVNCYVKSFDLGGGSIQLEARNVRYQWFSELLLEHKLDKVSTAHHLNDSFETVLINLTRGTGIKGISGISIKNGQVIRPLLFTNKKALHTYAMDMDLDWREDSSNETTDYDRNLLRHKVIPELEKLNPSLLGTFLNTSERLNFANQVVAQRVRDVKSQHLNQEGDALVLNLHWISNASDELILSEILSDYGVNYVTAKEIFGARGKSGKSFQEGEWLITMDREAIYIDQNKSPVPKELIINEAGQYYLNKSEFSIEIISKEEVVFGSENVAFFDADQLEFPLKVRLWQEGDRFRPLGMKGEKKVSDFLIDEKVPVSRKKSIMILESNEKIVWIIGYRISDSFKISDQTEKVVKVTFSRLESV